MYESQLSALFWALPLVLLIGVVAVLALKRLQPLWMQTHTAPHTGPQRVGEALVLSDATTVHCVRLEGKLYLVSESSRQVNMHPYEPPTTPRKTGWNAWRQA